jgi:hypothetical protein
VKGSGFRVQGSGFRGKGSGFGVQEENFILIFTPRPVDPLRILKETAIQLNITSPERRKNVRYLH